jgi:hydrogenase maturation protein HypF
MARRAPGAGGLTMGAPALSVGGPASSERVRVRVRGLVQGVGFRPHVWRLARDLGLSGFALNDSDGVLIEVEGRQTDLFLRRLASAPPPLARIDALEREAIAPLGGDEAFQIRASADLGRQRTGVPADVAPCPACLADLFDKGGRRWRHAFVSCTDCGPRYTITRALPYDRPQTSMAAFPMCPDCAAEYADPADRRFHAEPIACNRCGPRLGVPVEAALATLRAGGIVALKGVGGFQLLCDADDPAAVARLRARKSRGGKPFAIMVANLASARALVALSPLEARALTDPGRPIVLARARTRAGPPEAVAPGLDMLGVMLPASPLHHLLFHAAAGAPEGVEWLDPPQALRLVCTSANPRGEPLVIEGAEAARRLAGVADLVVDHDRAIVARADDPVMRLVAGDMRVLRRGRGMAPTPIALPAVAKGRAPVILALGGHLKAAICVTREREAVLSAHVGDLDDPATIAFHEETARRLLSILDATPDAIACDMHPDFASTALAHTLGRDRGVPVFGVQHHHAHAASVLAEHGHEGPALALTLDGHGLGTDGEAWGGEALRLEGADFTRLGGLSPLAPVGGDKAARAPWRMAAAALHHLGRGHEIADRFKDEPHAGAVARLLAAGGGRGTSACGRLFDAAAGLLGFRGEQGFEAEAAQKLETLARRHGAWTGRSDAFAFDADGRLDLGPCLSRLADGMAREAGAAFFHAVLAAGLVEVCARAARATGLATIAVSGGCMANGVLGDALRQGLKKAGLLMLANRAAPPGDGGLALGQAWIARRRWMEMV